jgi:hypothetical protein
VLKDQDKCFREICEHLQEIDEVSADATIFSRYRQLQAFYGELESKNFGTERKVMMQPPIVPTRRVR